MAQLSIQQAVNGLISISIRLILVLSLFLLSSNHQHHHNDVFCAPQQQQQQQQSPLVAKTNAEKTADLSVLINETLTINNKTVHDEQKQQPTGLKDDWTFDMVEYDLMEFLQDLSARYRLANKNNSNEFSSSSSLANEQPESLEAKSENSKSPNLTTTSKQKDNQLDQITATATATATATTTTTTTTTTTITTTLPSKHDTNANKLSPKGQDKEEEKVKVTTNQEKQPTILVTSELPPISLASGDDHDIAESTWQYGIFDRFTRAKSGQTSTTTTTISPPFEPLLASGSSLDVRSFNSDECGLRSYLEQEEASYFPSNGFEQEQEQHATEASKELNQRRQRPPIGSSFFSSHKKYQSSGLGGVVGDDAGDFNGDDDQQLVRRPIVPPFDSYGESPAQHQHVSGDASPSSSSAHHHHHHHHSHGSDQNNNKQSDGPSSAHLNSDSSSGDGEFNLSFRRQWLQQQLGHTLQMLGFNTSTQSAAEFLNQTSGASLNFRENMMRKSNLNSMNNNKAAKSLDFAATVAAQLSPQVIPEQQPEISEQELKARQDELKLEARVIGGSDARLGDSPWSVSLQALVSRPGTGGVEYRHYCGGTIISEYYILTAAHCLDFMVGRESRLFVVVGDLNWRMSAASLHGRRFGIEKLIIHSGYKSTAFGHDIGLIRTKESMKPLKVNGRYIINSVCLPEKGVEHSGEAELVGWGLFSNRNEMADSLQIADVPILPRPLCVDLYKRRTGLIQWLIGIELITEKQVCAGTFGRGICQGDSGSALVFNEKFTRVQTRPDGKAAHRKNNIIRDQQTRATIIGIVAFGGIRRCSYQSLPGVYMQTSKYLDWILPRIHS